MSGDTRRLLEIEGEGDHLGTTPVDGPGELQLGFVCQILTIVHQDVAQPETELQLGDQFEIGEIEITAHANLHHAVEAFHEEGLVLAHSEVDGRGYIDDGIGAEVVVARCCDFQSDGYGEEGGLDVLCGVSSGGLLVEVEVLLPEADGGLYAQTKGLVETKLAEDADREAGLVVVDLGVPLLSGSGVYVAVVLQFQVHHVDADEETIVQEPVVQIGAVLDNGFLGLGASRCHQSDDED